MSVSTDTNANAQDPESGTGEQEVKGNPAWQPILDVLPESLHGIVAPELEKWDKGVQDKFSELHEKYAPVKDYVEYDPEVIAAGINLLSRLQDDPSAFYEQMGEMLGVTAQEAAELVDEATEETGEEVDPRLKALQDQIAELRGNQEQLTAVELGRQEDADMAALENLIAQAHTQHGDFDEGYVLVQMSQGMQVDAAVAQFKNVVEQYAKPAVEKEKAPVVLGGGGSIPSEVPDVTKLNSKDTVNLVEQILAAANKE